MFLGAVGASLLNVACYLYPSVDAAQKGERVGGSGFFIGIPSDAFPKTHFVVYAVTNRHVIEDAHSPIVRLNTTGGTFDILDIDPREWRTHPTGEDVAVCPMRFGASHHVDFIPIDMVLSEADAQTRIHVGQEVVMVGRFINHEGLQKNQPAMRFGNISILPGDPIRQDNGHPQVSYLVEGHSTGGYSGAPVLVDLGLGYPTGGPIRFLGIVWGHLQDRQPVMRGVDKHPDGWDVRANTGMINVVPGWMLQQLLDEPDLVEGRRLANIALSKEQDANSGQAEQGK